MRRVLMLLALTAFISPAIVVAPAVAHEGVTGIVKERMDAMSASGKAMKALGNHYRGKELLEAAELTRLAGVLGQNSGEAMTRLFPEGVTHMMSEALPAIWTDRKRFDAIAAELKTKAAALQTVAADPQAGMMAFLEVTKSCKSCHSDFRKKKEAK